MGAMYGMCPKMAPRLGKGISEAQRWTQHGYILNTGLKKDPNALLVTPGLHEFEATSETG